MNNNATYLSYRETGAFSKLVTDYIDGAAALQPFLSFTPDLEGIKDAIKNRESFDATNRTLLVEQLTKQYAGLSTSEKVKGNIQALSNANAYTICTAHQPNLFTGHLYFIYKILHAIKLADWLNEEIPQQKFVPVFYMGSEDADLDELGQVTIHGKELKWATEQRGAVGRMKVDDKLIGLIDELNGQLSVEEYGPEIIDLLNACYRKGRTIEQATFHFIDKLFADYGLVVLLPDNPNLKSEFKHTIKQELVEQFSSKAVSDTISFFPSEYKIQAGGRDINLFYLKDDLRARIERAGENFKIAGTEIAFTEDEILAELESHPERFSPNVITRPLYQEKILPNVVFIGGGAELAYWLELKSTFAHANIPYPILLLRNSFTVLDKKMEQNITALSLSINDLFKEESKILSHFVLQRSNAKLSLKPEKSKIADIYLQILNTSKAIDPTLQRHIEALSTQSMKRLGALEKKLLKAEKRKFEAEQRQIHKIRSAVFPGGTLQERVDNILPYYAKYGKSFLQDVYDHSVGFNMQFCVLRLQGKTTDKQD